MKQKWFSICTASLIAGMLFGCSIGISPMQTSYISADNACAAALAAAGVDTKSAEITSAQLAQKEDSAYYEVNFTAANIPYRYYIDAMTGTVIEGENLNQNVSADATLGSDTNTAVSSENIPSDLSEAQAVVTDYDNLSTPVNHSSSSKGTFSAPAAPTEITLTQAKQTALDHAGKKESQVKFIKARKEFEDERWIYEIEFVSQTGNDDQEYDYEISANDGTILSYDHDAENDLPQNQNSTTKTESEARSIALAKIPGAKAQDCTLWLEQDDGRLVYEGTILYDFMEYEFKIDAYSGTILEWEAESVYD